MLTEQEQKDIKRYKQMAHEDPQFFEAGIHNIKNPSDYRVKRAYLRALERIEQWQDKGYSNDFIFNKITRTGSVGISRPTFDLVLTKFTDHSKSFYDNIYHALGSVWKYEGKG